MNLRMHWLGKLPIKTKLVAIILLTSFVALIVEGLGFVAYERVRVRDELKRDLGSLARIVADRSTAALTFNDDQVARETLAALKVKRVITAACLYDSEGKVFARYDSGEERPFAFPADPGYDTKVGIENGYLHLTEPVMMDGLPIGAVFIRASLRELDLLWQNFLLFVALIIFVTSLITLWLAARVQRVVSEPLEQLTGTALAITAKKDYSLRAEQTSDDEIGTLVLAFNEMLEAIEARNRELLKANQRLADSEGELKVTNESLERMVAHRTAELQALFDSASVGIALMKDRIILRCNRRMDEMFGYDYGEQIAQPTRIWYPDETAWDAGGQPVYEQIWRGQTHVREQLLVRKDGSPFWVRLSGRAIDATDTSRGTVFVIEDITAERAAMEEMRKARTLAEDATRMKSEFLANMSHEIRTPMNAILGMLYLALKDSPTPSLRNYIAKAQGAAHSLLGIINDILDFSKIEAGKLEIERVEFGLDGVLEQLTDTIGVQAEEKGIEFLIRYDVAIPPRLVGDPLRLRQVLLNLCGNSVKFTERGEVELAFRCLDRSESELTMQITVRDSGMGMAPETQAKLFEKFSQADQSTTRRFGGTGLGLAISKNLVELMGGRIWVEDSQPGKGTSICFTVRMEISPQTTAQRPDLVEQAGPLLQGIRVLVVDDNAVSREILAELLRHFHLDVAVAANASIAVARLEAATVTPFDLVLMDWRMPGMNGDEATQRIHTNPAITHKPKVVIVTAYGREDVIRLSEQAGVDGFLIKPVSPSTLLDTILSVLGRGRLLGKSDALPSADTLAAANAYDLAGMHLLLVEDNDINREFATGLLRSEGMEVDEAANGQIAVEMVQAHDYDAVLMDIQMPVMDGLEATRCIRALAETPGNERFASLTIIAMTALAMARDAENTRAAGMNDHVTKPIAPDRLFATLAKWRQPRAGAASTQPLRRNTARLADLPADLAALACLDAREGIRRIGGNETAYRKQLRRFRENYADAVDQLQDRLSAQEAQKALDYCHTLKGVIGNLGASALYEQLIAIDAGLREGLRPTAATLDELYKALNELLREIDSLAPDTLPPVTAQAMEAAQLRDRLERLAKALEYDLGAAEPLLQELRAGVARTALATQIETIASRIDVFAIDEALALLQTLLKQVRPEI